MTRSRPPTHSPGKCCRCRCIYVANISCPCCRQCCLPYKHDPQVHCSTLFHHEQNRWMEGRRSRMSRRREMERRWKHGIEQILNLVILEQSWMATRYFHRLVMARDFIKLCHSPSSCRPNLTVIELHWASFRIRIHIVTAALHFEIIPGLFG